MTDLSDEARQLWRRLRELVLPYRIWPDPAPEILSAIDAAFAAVREDQWRDSQLVRLASVLLNECGASEALPGVETAIYTLHALRERAERAEAELKAAREDNARLADLYGELLRAVINKYPGESRHQTALRFIQQAERGNDSACAGGPR